MTASELQHLNVVRRYFDGCNTGDLDTLLSTMTAEVKHYFLPTSFPPIMGADHLARYWRKYKQVLDPQWSIDRLVARDEVVVNEWSCLWTPPGTDKRVMSRGTEWYVMRDGKIDEIRAYFIADSASDTELGGFAYRQRGYLVRSDA